MMMVVVVVVAGNRWGVSRKTRPKLIVTTFKVFSPPPLFKITRKKTPQGGNRRDACGLRFVLR